MNGLNERRAVEFSHSLPVFDCYTARRRER